jgi:hypothetical protein
MPTAAHARHTGFGGGGTTFSFGGPGGARVYTAGGGQRRAGAGGARGPQAADSSPLLQLLPLLILGLFSLISYLPSLLATPDPSFTWAPSGVHTAQRFTPRHGVSYHVSPVQWEKHPFVEQYKAGSHGALKSFEERVENGYKNQLYASCERSREHQQRRILNTRGFLGIGVSVPARLGGEGRADAHAPAGPAGAGEEDQGRALRGLRAPRGLRHLLQHSRLSSLAFPARAASHICTTQGLVLHNHLDMRVQLLLASVSLPLECRPPRLELLPEAVLCPTLYEVRLGAALEACRSAVAWPWRGFARGTLPLLLCRLGLAAAEGRRVSPQHVDGCAVLLQIGTHGKEGVTHLRWRVGVVGETEAPAALEDEL